MAPPKKKTITTGMGGYQLMVSADIFRGRYRESLEMPAAHHVLLPGHRIMVQIQSSWFQIYDRNPQTFVPNIFWAKPGDYRTATQRIYYAPERASLIERPLVEGADRE
jgi:predicted acyl esterase